MDPLLGLGLTVKGYFFSSRVLKPKSGYSIDAVTHICPSHLA